jgi:hypothetical protein
MLLEVEAPPGRLLAPAFSVGDLVMAGRQLLNLKELAEQARAAPASRAVGHGGKPMAPPRGRRQTPR